MSSKQIEEQLSATGVAQVIAVVAPSRKTPGAARDDFDSGTFKSLAATLLPKFLDTNRSRNLALLSAGESAGNREGFAGRTRAGETNAVRIYPNLGLMLGTVDRQGYRSLKSDKRLSAIVAAPELSLIRPKQVERAGRERRSWGLSRLAIPAVWKQDLTGKGVRIGHLDTGVDASHPALEDAIHAFAEFDNLGRKTAGAKARDSDNHGTHTAGTAVGRMARGRVIGVAPGAKLVSALVIEGGNIIARVLGGMDWAIGEGIRVLSLSLGVPGLTHHFFRAYAPLFPAFLRVLHGN
jgi:subtilisin